MAMPAISIAHSDGHAVALAGYCADGQRLGIDLERIRPRADSFLTIAFSDAELTLLQSVAGSERDEWVTRLWCAKEAVAKALGKGLVDGPRSLAVRSLDAPTGRVAVVLGAGLARRVPEFAGAGLVAHTVREDDWVAAISLCDRS
jgi:phosphopantetheinyl transferase